MNDGLTGAESAFRVGVNFMDYIRAADILPQELIEELQQYVDGTMLYIPKKKEEKKSWGEQTTTRVDLAERNAQICAEYIEGKSVQLLAEKYFLAKKSIQRIIRQEKLKQIEKE